MLIYDKLLPEKKLFGYSLVVAPTLFAASTFLWKNEEYGIDGGTLLIF